MYNGSTDDGDMEALFPVEKNIHPASGIPDNVFSLQNDESIGASMVL